MSSIGSGYDWCCSTYSPDGRIFQVEYAEKAVQLSGTTVGLRGKDGIVFAVENLVTSKLYEPGTNKRTFTVDRHIGIATAGLLADSRHLVEVAKQEAKNYRTSFGDAIPVKLLKERLSAYMHAYTLDSLRAFGTSVIVAAHGSDISQLYRIDPSGVSFGYFGCAIGKGEQAAKTEMEKLDLKNMGCQQLVKEAAKIIYLVHDEVKDKDFELELSWVGDVSNGKHVFVPDCVFKEAEAFAKASLEEAPSETGASGDDEDMDI